MRLAENTQSLYSDNAIELKVGTWMDGLLADEPGTFDEVSVAAICTRHKARHHEMSVGHYVTHYSLINRHDSPLTDK